MGASAILRRTPAWARDPLYRAAGQLPSLDLQFARRRDLINVITGRQALDFTRTSARTIVNAANAVEAIGVNQAPFTFRDGVSLGLDAWDARTNSIRNNTMVGAVPGLPGTLPANWFITNATGLTQSVVGTGVVDGINFTDVRFNGTSSGNVAVVALESASVTLASNGQAWAESAWLSIVGGSLANISNISLVINQFNSGVTFLSSLVGPNLVGTLSNALARQEFVATTSNASTARVQPVIVLNYGIGVPIDITLRIGMPQLELGPNVSPVIPTSGSALVRAGDVPTSTDLSWYIPGGLFYIEFTFASLVAPNGARIFELTNGLSDFIRARAEGGVTKVYEVLAGGVDQATLVPASSAISTATVKAAFAVAPNAFALSENGAALIIDSSGSLPAGPTSLCMGVNSIGSGQMQGSIGRLAYFPPGPVLSRVQRLSA